MAEFFIPVSFAILASAVMILLDLVKGFRLPGLYRVGSKQTTMPYVRPDPRVLNSRVQLTRQKKDDCLADAFAVEISGSIHAPGGMHYTIVQISIADMTEGISKPTPVHSSTKQWQMNGSPVFVYSAELGRLPNQVTTLSDWISVAQLPAEWMMFPRKGKRTLQFTTLILSRWNGQELACATSDLTYDNAAFGYIDSQENTERAKSLAVGLALAVSAADNKLSDCEIQLIKNWARDNIDLSRASGQASYKLEKALNQIVNFFRDGNQLDTHKICEEIVEIAPLAQRYDILELCLYVAQADGVATLEELALLKNLASWLEVDMNRFRAMVDKILPVDIHESEDTEAILGVTSDMGKDETRDHLNKEYRKWNARVTNFDPKIQAQADHMLRLIAAARTEHVG